jgi:hypothetical protein
MKCAGSGKGWVIAVVQPANQDRGEVSGTQLFDLLKAC